MRDCYCFLGKEYNEVKPPLKDILIEVSDIKSSNIYLLHGCVINIKVYIMDDQYGSGITSKIPSCTSSIFLH